MHSMLFAVLALFLAASPLSAATYYIDFGGGADANNGTASSTPWQHYPNDDNATGTAASTTLSAGDTLIFKGAVAYQGITTTTAAGHPAVLYVTTAGSSGSGNVASGNLVVDPAFVGGTLGGLTNLPTALPTDCALDYAGFTLSPGSPARIRGIPTAVPITTDIQCAVRSVVTPGVYEYLTDIPTHRKHQHQHQHQP